LNVFLLSKQEKENKFILLVRPPSMQCFQKQGQMEWGRNIFLPFYEFFIFSVCLSICLFVRLFVCLFACLFVCFKNFSLFLFLFVCSLIFLPFYAFSSFLFVCSVVFLSFSFLFVFTFVFLSFSLCHSFLSRFIGLMRPSPKNGIPKMLRASRNTPNGTVIFDWKK
jgi:hypothetical protein